MGRSDLGIGSARLVVDTAGTVKDSYDYFAFGGARSQAISTGQSYRYTGKPFDNDHNLNLHYYGARYYDGTTGRFISVDPLAARYPTFSPYVYVANNPIIFIDANGDSVRVPAGTLEEAQFVTFLEMGRAGRLGKDIGNLLAFLDGLPYDVYLEGGDVPDKSAKEMRIGTTALYTKTGGDSAVAKIRCIVDVAQIKSTKRTEIVFIIVHELSHAEDYARLDRKFRGKELDDSQTKAIRAQDRFRAYMRALNERKFREFKEWLKRTRKEQQEEAERRLNSPEPNPKN